MIFMKLSIKIVKFITDWAGVTDPWVEAMGPHMVLIDQIIFVLTQLWEIK